MVLDEPFQRLLREGEHALEAGRLPRTESAPTRSASFSDLVMATVTSPAMLEYLDNAQSASGR